MKNNASKLVIIFVVALLTAIALFIRIQFITDTKVILPFRADAGRYVQYAINLVHNQTFSSDYFDPKLKSNKTPRPDSYRSPGYPLFLAAILTLSKSSAVFYQSTIIVQAIISALLVPLTYALTRFFLPIVWSLICALLVLFNPHLISMTNLVLSETVFAFFLTAACLAFFFFLKYPNPLLSVTSGLLFGMAYLTNETILFIPLLFASAVFLIIRKRVSGGNSFLLKSVLIFLVIYFLFPFSWNIRNQLSLSTDATKSKDRAIKTMSHGAYPDFIYKDPKHRYYPYREDPMQPEFGSSFSKFATILWERFKTNPAGYLKWYLLQKPVYLWSWSILQGHNDIHIYSVRTSWYTSSSVAQLSKLIIERLHIPLMLFALLGLFFSVPFIRSREGMGLIIDTPLLLLVVLLYCTLLYMVFAPWPRYAIPFRPLFYTWSLWSIWSFASFFLPSHKFSSKR
jgi:4-amino-4-deoxy-L-arabinose transferase-like glycosyltransferase